MRTTKTAIFYLLMLTLLGISTNLSAVTITPNEDVMTSGFFFGPDFVRGYNGDNRSVLRVSNTNPFGTTAAETVYLTFDANDFASFTGPVTANLSVESVSGGFGADAGPGNPFTVSAHAVNADPLTSITDDTNPAGPISWNDFFDNNILAADSAAISLVDAFEAITFDVSSIVNGWIEGSNSIFAIALTGKNETSDNDFLHGFLNNTENPGSTFLTVTAVPIPAAIWMFASVLIGMMGFKRISLFS
ncbi:MAG: hypothetical protein AAF304_10635 [Pseudomonadota bacterium]